MKPDTWLEEFVELKGLVTLCDLLEMLEKSINKDEGGVATAHLAAAPNCERACAMMI